MLVSCPTQPAQSVDVSLHVKNVKFTEKVMKKALFGLIILVLLSGMGASSVAQSPPHHESWHDQLQQFVSPDGRVNYASWKQQTSRLDAYLSTLEAQPPTTHWSKNQKLAYWINAYNAYTVKLILDHYPLGSITNLDQPWDSKWISIGGTTHSLNDIEHNILRDQLKENRVHFVVNCASISCPPLLNQAYTAANVQQLFDQQARRFIRDSRYNRVAAQELQLSKIFDWYRSDFEQSGSLIDFLNRYVETEINGDADISFLEYNWELNER